MSEFVFTSKTRKFMHDRQAAVTDCRNNCAGPVVRAAPGLIQPRWHFLTYLPFSLVARCLKIKRCLLQLCVGMPGRHIRICLMTSSCIKWNAISDNQYDLCMVWLQHFAPYSPLANKIHCKIFHKFVLPASSFFFTSNFSLLPLLLFRDGSYGVGLLYVVSCLSRIYPYFSNCSV